MKDKLEYRDNSYFNSNDLYMFDNGLEKWYISKVHFHNGFWYSDVACNYKMTSVPSVNCKELYHFTISLSGVKGTICKFLSVPNNDFGISWESGENIRKYGLPHFWNDINLFRTIIN